MPTSERSEVSVNSKASLSLTYLLNSMYDLPFIGEFGVPDGLVKLLQGMSSETKTADYLCRY